MVVIFLLSGRIRFRGFGTRCFFNLARGCTLRRLFGSLNDNRLVSASNEGEKNACDKDDSHY